MNIWLGKLTAAAITDERGQNAAGWVLLAILAPIIILIAALCAAASGGAEHNNSIVKACFYSLELSEKVPNEYRQHISHMRSAFSLLDSAVSEANMQMEDGNSLDPMRVKAIFFALCFGEDAPTARAANSFAECFYTMEQAVRRIEEEDDEGNIFIRDESYLRAVPLSLENAYSNVRMLLGRDITDDDRNNISHIYSMVAGSMGIDSYNGSYAISGGKSLELDASKFKNVHTKNADDLVTYAVHAWESGWGYVWGTYGCVLTESQFNSKLQQYPEGVGKYADFIRENWVGGRTADCVGLIKGYGWLNPDTLTIDYGTNGMPDISANQMYYNASQSGTIDTIPEIPGLAVWHNGHIGVYIGNGEVIEAMGTKYGVVRTQLEGRGWTHWLKIAYIDYD